MTRTTHRHRVLILGAGYTGMMAAIRTAKRTRRHDTEVTLVNPYPRFTERLRMHQLATGQQLAYHRIADLVDGSGILFVQGWATSIDPDDHVVHVDTDEGLRRLPYDTLIFALGSSTDTSIVPGADDHAHTLNGPQAAAAFATCLADLAFRGGKVTVAGAGLTGIEAATEIAENYPSLQVTLLSREELASQMGPKARAYLNEALDRLRIEVRTDVEITKVLPNALELADGEPIRTDATLWTTGVRTSPLAAQAGLTVDDQNRIVVDPTLRSVSHPDVYAVGDAASVHQKYGVIHGTCQSGIPTAAHAADSIARQLRGRTPKPFRFGYIHQPVSLGRKDAVIQFTRPDDSPGRFYMTGRKAVRYKETVSSSPAKTFRLSKRVSIPTRILWRH